MSNSNDTESGKEMRSGEDYFARCLGATAVIACTAEWISHGCPIGEFPRWLGYTIGWVGLVLPELLTLWALSRRLRVLSLSRLWLLG